MRISRALFLGVLTAALAAAGPGAAKTYTVKKGDTLYELSRKFHVGVDDLKRANGLRSDSLRPGAKLKVPGKGESSRKVAARKGSQEKGRPEEQARAGARTSEARGTAGDQKALHTIKRGDTLIAIARAYGVEVKELQRLNGLKRRSVLRPGQELVVGHRPPADRDQTYQVRKGDTLNKISKRFHLSVAEIKELNGLRSDALRRGQTLFVARRAEAAEEPAPEEQVTECKLEEAPVDQDLEALSEGAGGEGESGVADRLLRVAKRMLNIPYRFGGNSNRGIDCSAYVQKVFRFLNMSLPRTAREQYNLGSEVSRDDLVAGDLVFFRTYARYPSHVGIYIGDNQFIHASSKGRKVTIDSIDEPFYNKRFIGAKRLVREGEIEAKPEAAPQASGDESSG